MGCFSSKNSPKADQHADARNGVSRSRSHSAPAALQLKTGSLSSFPKENQRYGQRPSLPAFASQNYKGHEQRHSATSSSFPEFVSVQELPKTTDDGSKSTVIDLTASSSSLIPDKHRSQKKILVQELPKTTDDGSQSPAPLLRKSPVMDLIEPSPPETENHQRYVLKKYGFNELSQATGGFNNNGLLGEGGFGQVYKATLDRKVVAIKKLKMLPGSDVHSGEQPEIAEQLEEIDFLSIVSHQNVVRLIGYCSEGMNRLLVLEYVPNKSLRFHLNANELLEWSNRMKIAIGSAEGLQYLHNGCVKRIIHRDIKAENILIDDDFESKARTQIEQALDNGEYTILVDSILQSYDEKKIKRMIMALVDSKLEKNYVEEEVKKMIFCAIACINNNSVYRPPMQKLIGVLKGTIMPPEKILDWEDNKSLHSTIYKVSFLMAAMI